MLQRSSGLQRREDIRVDGHTRRRVERERVDDVHSGALEVDHAAHPQDGEALQGWREFSTWASE